MVSCGNGSALSEVIGSGVRGGGESRGVKTLSVSSTSKIWVGSNCKLLPRLQKVQAAGSITIQIVCSVAFNTCVSRFAAPE